MSSIGSPQCQGLQGFVFGMLQAFQERVGVLAHTQREDNHIRLLGQLWQKVCVRELYIVIGEPYPLGGDRADASEQGMFLAFPLVIDEECVLRIPATVGSCAVPIGNYDREGVH